MPPCPEGSERLMVCAQPNAMLHLIETQPPLFNDGVQVERYTTRHKIVFEKHTAQNGCITWYRVCK
jgi:hypothetical protein